MTSPTRVEGYFWGFYRRLVKLTPRQRRLVKEREAEEQMMLAMKHKVTILPQRDRPPLVIEEPGE